MSKTHQAHYISGTHWDREWYRTQQEFRLLLVEILDGLLAMMESSEDFKYFHLDGQTCILEDYLEIRPENEGRLRAMVKSGRILIGPWYTMPDLFCPGDEALVRNLLMGQSIARDWEVKSMNVAYTCDMFGHPSQMPQIFQGFDLPYCVVGRGTNEAFCPAFFEWKTPDGSKVLTFKLQDAMGYGAFVDARQILEGPDKDKPDAESRAIETIRQYTEGEIKRTNGTALCLFDALDHMTPASDAARYVRMTEAACPEVVATHSTLPAFFEEARQTATEMPVMEGELRQPGHKPCGYNWLIPNCTSSRIRMKQANDHCQNLLERWVEPFDAVAPYVLGKQAPRTYLESAWKYLLLNHAHDSICGCSIDQVHRDMMYRFDQSRMIAEQLRSRLFGDLTALCRNPAQEGEFALAIANPLPFDRKEVVTFPVDLPKDWTPEFSEGFWGSQAVKTFLILDEDGHEIPYQRLDVMPHYRERSQYAFAGWNAQFLPPFARYTVAAELELPATGFKVVRVVPPEVRFKRAMGTMLTGPTAAENEYLNIQFESNGSVVLTDKRSGEVYRDLFIFEDRSEIGSGWFHSETQNEEAVLSTCSRVQLSVTHNGPEMVTFKEVIELRVPKRYDWSTEHRSDEREALMMTLWVSLRRGADQLDVELEINNTAEDHELKMLLPTDMNTNQYLAHTAFDIVERGIELDRMTADWQEVEISEKPFLNMIAVGEGKRGLALLAGEGLHEGGLKEDTRRTMELILLRSFRRTVGTSNEQDGLEQGMIRHKLAVMPFAGELDRVDALNRQSAVVCGVLTRQTGSINSGYPPMNGEFSPVKSFMRQLDCNAVISAMKTADDGEGIVVRLWNPGDKACSERLQFWQPIRLAQRLKLSEHGDEEALAPVVSGDEVSVELKSHQIVTLRVVF